MSRCGYCNKTGLELQGEGGDALLEPHTMADSRKRCRRLDNPSLISLKFQNEMSTGDLPPSYNEDAFDQMWKIENGIRGARKARENTNERSKIRSIAIKRRRDRGFNAD